MFDSLTQKILSTLRVLSGKGRLDGELLDEICRQLRITLLDADVNVKVVKDFVQAVREKATGVEIHRSLTPEQQFIKIVYEELTNIMGKKATPLELNVRPPAVILMVGLQGSGKTTTTVKLAHHLKNTLKKNVVVASVDVYRPAAIEQLAILAKNQSIDYCQPEPDTHVVRDRAMFIREEAIRRHDDVVVIDTAGRLHVDAGMMAELQELQAILSPAEILLVLDSMTGQDAVKIAEAFHEALQFTGIVLTKLDGDSRGGAALSVRAVTGCPIKFVGVGEKPADLEVFHPDRIASRILDMGDLLSLVEKATHVLDPIESIKLAKKIKKNEFTLADFYSYIQQVKKMGSFETLMKFLPGMQGVSKQLTELSPPDDEFKKVEAIILSMTLDERFDHGIIDGSRRRRVAKGSGTKVEDVNRLMKQFLEARKMMGRMTKSPMGKRRSLW